MVGFSCVVVLGRFLLWPGPGYGDLGGLHFDEPLIVP